jgi:hypothetical protein
MPKQPPIEHSSTPLFKSLNALPRNRYLFPAWKSYWAFCLSKHGNRIQALEAFKEPQNL